MGFDEGVQDCPKCGSRMTGGECPSCGAENVQGISPGLLMPTEDGERGKLTGAQLVIISVRALLGAGVGALAAIFGLMIFGLAIGMSSFTGLIFNSPYGVPAVVIGICLGYFIRWRWLKDSI